LRLDIGRSSIVIMRGADQEVRAFHNVCRHRGRVGSWRGPGFNSPDVSTIPPIIPQGGFSPLRLEGWLARRDLPARQSA
jgi:hypothetical protein